MPIDEFVNKLEKKTDKLERDLYDEIMAIIIGLVFVDDKAVWNVKNISCMGKVDEAFKSFDAKFQIPFIDSIKKELAGLNKYYIDYFETIGVDSQALKGFKTLISRMDAYLDSVALLDPVKQEVKSYVLSSISSHKSFKTMKGELQDILGLKERSGVLNRYYRQFLYDNIMQFDRIVSNMFAEQNELNYFVYTGGLIEDSREFCIKRDGLVFRRDMVDDWAKDPTLPGYPNVADYDPLVDCGRWNCRHWLTWITDEQAKELMK